MIDIHAPHETVHTWTDFLIHIATIVVGLVIAIGLEQTVELFHHKHEIRDARAALAAEHQENIRRYHDNVSSHLMRTAFQHNDQRILRFVLGHPGGSEDKLPGVMRFGAITIQEPVESAWITVEHTDVISLLPPAEVRAYAAEYTELERESTMFHALQDHLTLCAAYLTHTADVSSLTSAELENTLACEVSAQSFESVYGDQLSVIGSMNDYGPAIDWWKMIPFFQMGQAEAFGDNHPDLKAITDKDEAEALNGFHTSTQP